jgi:hypothetical protein
MLVICYLFYVCVCRLKAQQSLCLYVVLTMPTLNKTYLFIIIYYLTARVLRSLRNGRHLINYRHCLRSLPNRH